MKSLDEIRAGIDAVDDAIVLQLAKRRQWALRLAKIKRQKNIPIYDRAREAALVQRVKKIGREHQLNEEFIDVVFRLIVMNSKEEQYHENI